MPGDYEKLSDWATRLTRVANEPISEAVKANIASRLHKAAVTRARNGVTPQGAAFQPLSPGYRIQKKKAGVRQEFWIGPGSGGKGGGQAMKRIDETIRGDQIQQIINVPYSGAVHDGAIIHRMAGGGAKRKLSPETVKRQTKARKKAFEAMLKKAYGKRTAAANRKAHAEMQRQARNARANHNAWSIRTWRRIQNRRKVQGPTRLVTTIVIPARPILGLDDDLREYIGTQLLRDVASRMRGGG